ncbi:MAG: adenine deaminase [Candidatus Saganbacteria bacterium]|nr:adenine deaminase [Candidatus Saganbacteria bacterium]
MLRDLIEVAKGKKKASLLLKNCQVINVINGEITPTSVAIYKDKIAGFGEYEAEEVIDLNGQYVAPSFIDSHIHIESSMLNPAEFAKTVIPHGTGAVIADPHEIANVLGIAGIKYMLSVTEFLPIDFYFTLSSCVPSSILETSGARLEANTLAPLMKNKRVVGLAEMMNFPGVISQNINVLKKIEMAGSKVIDGHAPGLSGKNLQAYIAAGISNDHECISLEEAREKLKLGMFIKIREGTSAKNLTTLLPLVNQKNSYAFSFCTDDIAADDLSKGHINLMVKKAVELGMDPVMAVRLASFNPALHYGLKSVGAVAPGYFADLVVLGDLHEFKIKMVYKRGRVVFWRNRMIASVLLKKKKIVKETINVKPFKTEAFRIKAEGSQVKNAKIIQIVSNQLITQKRVEEVRVQDGLVIPDIAKDIIKIAVVERHKASGKIGLGLVSGFGLNKGAIAQSISHDSHNIICIGADDEDMASAVRQVIKMKGGIAIVAGGLVLAQIALPIAGLMSELNADDISRDMEKLVDTAAKLGSKIKDPFLVLSFLALPVIPELRITDHGLVETANHKLVRLFE